MICENIAPPIFLFFTNEVPPLLYYSHITSLIVALLVGLVVYFTQRSISGRILMIVSVVYSLFVIFSLIVWTNVNSQTITFVWSMFGVTFSLLAFFLVYLSYVFVTGKDLGFKLRLELFLLIIPVLIFTSTKHNVAGFDMDLCGVGDMEGKYFTLYYYLLGAGALVTVTLMFFREFFQLKDKNQRLKILYFTLGVDFFILLFFGNSSLVSYLAEKGILADYSLEMYGLFGMVIFMAIIAFLIVRYKAFDIKLLATQALIWTLIILVGSQFFFIKTPINFVLNGITFVGAIISGILIVRSVKRVDAQREQLALANQEQETLVHFITHQIKGFFTKSRNIFDTLTDMENVPESAHRLITEGLRSDKEGVELVENILNAANLKSGKIQFKDEKGSLDQMVKKLVDDMTPIAAAKNLKINLYCSTPIQYYADSFRLRDLFKNLISNSINYTFEGGITIYLNKKPDHVEFIIKDTGIGLTEDDKHKLFTSGGRGTESVKFNVSSTGYGLFIAKKVVDYYHGRIWAESDGRNKGTTFVVTLPLEK